MKAILCTDITNDKHNETLDGEEFIVARVPEYQQRALEEMEDDVEEIKEQSGLSKPLKILKFITELGAICFLYPVLNIIDGTFTVRQQFETAPVLVLFSLISIVLFPILHFADKRMLKNTAESDDTERKLRNADATVLASYELLGVDPEAPDVDVFMMKYKRKGDELKIKPEGGMFDFANFDAKLFADEEYLYLADVETKYAFPKAAMTGIRRIDKKVSFFGWHKETDYDKGEYKPHKIKSNQGGMLFVKPYYALQMSVNGEDYELYFPPYELPVMQELTGLAAD